MAQLKLTTDIALILYSSGVLRPRVIIVLTIRIKTTKEYGIPFPLLHSNPKNTKNLLILRSRA